MNLETEIAPKLAEQYADMLSLDFRRRNTLLNSWNHFTNDLVLWDKRLQTYIEGLKYLKDDASTYFNGWSDSLLTRGDTFALGIFSFYVEDAQLLEKSLSLSLAMPHFDGVTESILAWAPSSSTLWEAIFSSPTLRMIATNIRNDLRPVPKIKDGEIDLLMSSSAPVAGLIRTLHHQQHPDYHSIIRQLVSADDPQIRLNVLKTILTHHLPHTDLAVENHLLDLLANSNEKISAEAIRLYLCNTFSPASELFKWLKENETDERLYLMAMGYSGVPANIEILKEYLDKPEYARLACAAIVAITGASPESAGWLQITPYADNAKSDNDRDSSLSWPDKLAFDHWWKTHAHQFDSAQMYVAGQSVTKDGLLHVLRHGCLALHPLAKSRLSHLFREPVNQSFALTYPATHYLVR